MTGTKDTGFDFRTVIGFTGVVLFNYNQRDGFDLSYVVNRR